MLELDDQGGLRAFHLLFRRSSFTLTGGATSTFLETALAEGLRYEERVAQDLSANVFQDAFPSLTAALAQASGAELSQVRQAVLIFLYRLLFVLYAEDRGLLPVNDSRYDDYSLRKRVRDDVSRRMAQGDAFSAQATSYYDHLVTLFGLIDKGDDSIGLPPYNGGLFSPEAAPLLKSVRLPDNITAPVVHGLSHTKTASGYRFVNYRDMSVQQLGSIYQRLLEREPVRDESGNIVIRPNPYARKDSGSFYTPQQLVDLIVERTLGPLEEERLKAFEEQSARLKSDSRSKDVRLAELLLYDPAEAVLGLRVLDPAMGSGHFLVTAVDHLSDYISSLIEYVPVVADWLDGRYVSPLVQRIAAIREDLLQRARESNWVLDEAQLTDQAIIRRMVLKRCIYGVDKNPLTVELAKVSLWLHSFTGGAPLSFLDHHLRCGDSLVGLRVNDAVKDMARLGGLFSGSAIQAAENATEGMHQIELMSDADVAEVRESASLFREVEAATAELRGVLDTLCGVRWLAGGMKKKERSRFEEPLAGSLALAEDRAYRLLARGPSTVAEDEDLRQRSFWPAFEETWDQAGEVAGREGFLHWEASFPGVWQGWLNARPQGGFDAVIGNPPWERIKLQEVEWFATRSPGLALAPTAAARRSGIEELRKKGDPLAAEFDAAKTQAEGLTSMIRSYGGYPLLSGGDVNLYSLFVERAMSLVKPGGIIGLLTPSGIYADKTASGFFRSISGSGRLASLFDFENRRLGTDLPPHFPDVDSRFKFCALTFGGEERHFDRTECSFFLHDTATIRDQDRCFTLEPQDFSLVNPNTVTAPVFLTRRDAEITRRVYQQHPVLVDRSGSQEERSWPVRYHTMFHMTNDSHLFRTAAQLQEEGFYPVQGNRWKRGHELYLPLYQGRMIGQFDHRCNSVTFNPENTHNPYLSEEVSVEKHSDARFLPLSQYWVPSEAVFAKWPEASGHSVGFRDIARPTDARTMIATIIPHVGCGNKLPLLLPNGDNLTATSASCLVANLNCIPFDFITRSKVQGTNINWFILEQLPVIKAEGYDQKFGSTTARDLVRDHVLRLTYTAHDMAPFARDLGYDGPPFIWDEEERRHLRARLDALYFHLYGLDRGDADYILGTFPIVRREDEAQFGKFRTRELVLAYMNALSAADTETVVAL